MYTNFQCPYAQRVWITRNYKGLQDKIKFVPIDLQNRPAWYKEKVYPENKVPALEHNNKIIGESLDLVKYIDSNFEGPSLLPNVTLKILLIVLSLSYIPFLACPQVGKAAPLTLNIYKMFVNCYRILRSRSLLKS
nr:glutathione S-transferase L3-like isoform X1 [Ipomoea batatas]